MRSGFRQWFAERAELIVLGVTLLATASLVVWWTILLRGEMRTNEYARARTARPRAGPHRSSRSRARSPRSATPSRQPQGHAGRRVDVVRPAAVGQPGGAVPAGAAAQAAARRHGEAAAIHQPRIQDARGRRQGPAAEPGHRQHSGSATRRAHQARADRVRSARASGRNHPRLSARHVARAARRRAAHRRRAVHRRPAGASRAHRERRRRRGRRHRRGAGPRPIATACA